MVRLYGKDTRYCVICGRQIAGFDDLKCYVCVEREEQVDTPLTFEEELKLIGVEK